MSRTLKIGGLYALTSKREGSTFKALIRVCRHQDAENFTETIFFEDFLDGNLVKSTSQYRLISTTEVELDVDVWEQFNVECIGSDIKRLLRFSYETLLNKM